MNGGRLPGPRTPLGHLWWGVRQLRDPYETLMAAYRRWGRVFAIGYGPLRYVYVLGPEANEMILHSRARDFTWREAFKSLIPVDGDTALVVSDGAEHARRRSLVQPAFTLRRIRTYDAIIREEADRMLARWNRGDKIDVHAEVKSAVRRIAIRTLFGDRLGERADELGRLLQVAIDYANIPPLPGRDLDLPGSPYRRAMKARRRADEIIFEEIKRRRRQRTDEGDLLSALIEKQDGDSEALTDQELRDQVVSLIAGGYETTSALVAWALYAIHADPEIEGRLRGEIDANAGTEAPDVDEWPYLDAVVSETLRLHSPAGFAGRNAEVDVEFAGHTIPAGSLVVYSQYVTHRLSDHWPDPRRFSPERWLGEGNQRVEPEPYTFVPFGGGYRRCIGFAMATVEAKILIARTLTTRQLELDRTDVKAAGIATFAPKGGIPATVR